MTATFEPTRASSLDAYHSWRLRQNVVVLLGLSLLWACLMGLLAQIRIPLWFTPVPITLQVFGVVLAPIALGTLAGTSSQVLYVGLGAIGLPWFQSWNGGMQYLAGATGGYLVAYPVAALVVGALVWHRPASRLRVWAASLLALLVIYVMGVSWLAYSYDLSLARAVALGAAPFVVVDLIKIAVVAALTPRLLPTNHT